MTEAEIAELQPQVSEWEIVEQEGIKKLSRVFRFDDFAKALAFTTALGELAEEEAHHPTLLTEWGRTTVTWWTHKIKGLHRNDFIMTTKAPSHGAPPGRASSAMGRCNRLRAQVRLIRA